MTTLRLPQAAALSRQINDVTHRLAVVFVGVGAPESHEPGMQPVGGWAVALVAVPSGEVLAWDGWYSMNPDEEDLPLNALRGVEWDEWDDMPSKLLVRQTRGWLGGPVADWLLPTYSVAREAADLYISHFDGDDSRESNQSFRESSVVAYLPLVDEAVFTDEVARIGGRLRGGDRGALVTLEGTLRALDQS